MQRKRFYVICETRLQKVIQYPLDSLLGCSPLELSLCSSPDLYLLSDLPKSFTSPTFCSHMAGPCVDIAVMAPAVVPAGSQHQVADWEVNKGASSWFYHPAFQRPHLVLHGTETRCPYWALPKMAELLSVLTILPLVRYGETRCRSTETRKSFTIFVKLMSLGGEHGMQ